MKYKVFSIIFSILLVITLPLALCSCSTQKSSKNDEILMVASFKGSPKQFRLAYHSHPEPVKPRWVVALVGQ